MRKRKILEIAHESVFGAHLGAHKTIQRIKFSFYWPGMMAGGNLRLLHVNKIREYRVRVQTVGVIYDIDDEFGEIYETPTVSAAEKE
ncbi:hypothetical protein TNCV_4973401 [Trichonephila clavipes]|uniref:Integrase zinc-binding domain-containing protein n=1 Tax=Trichonephila clavipes TaxID=2585209 RepID=A0A8X6VMD7_TRICX|nr:hypothetical protein TNCV_4973401 [Trichonephila clavipes]